MTSTEWWSTSTFKEGVSKEGNPLEEEPYKHHKHKREVGPKYYKRWNPRYIYKEHDVFKNVRYDKKHKTSKVTKPGYLESKYRHKINKKDIDIPLGKARPWLNDRRAFNHSWLDSTPVPTKTIDPNYVIPSGLPQTDYAFDEMNHRHVNASSIAAIAATAAAAAGGPGGGPGAPGGPPARPYRLPHHPPPAFDFGLGTPPDVQLPPLGSGMAASLEEFLNRDAFFEQPLPSSVPVVEEVIQEPQFIPDQDETMTVETPYRTPDVQEPGETAIKMSEADFDAAFNAAFEPMKDPREYRRRSSSLTLPASIVPSNAVDLQMAEKANQDLLEQLDTETAKVQFLCEKMGQMHVQLEELKARAFFAEQQSASEQSLNQKMQKELEKELERNRQQLQNVSDLTQQKTNHLLEEKQKVADLQRQIAMMQEMKKEGSPITRSRKNTVDRLAAELKVEKELTSNKEQIYRQEIQRLVSQAEDLSTSLTQETDSVKNLHRDLGVANRAYKESQLNLQRLQRYLQSKHAEQERKIEALEEARVTIANQLQEEVRNNQINREQYDRRVRENNQRFESNMKEMREQMQVDKDRFKKEHELASKSYQDELKKAKKLQLENSKLISEIAQSTRDNERWQELVTRFGDLIDQLRRRESAYSLAISEKTTELRSLQTILNSHYERQNTVEIEQTLRAIEQTQRDIINYQQIQIDAAGEIVVTQLEFARELTTTEIVGERRSREEEIEILEEQEEERSISAAEQRRDILLTRAGGRGRGRRST